MEWRTPTSLIPSRPRDAVVSRDGPVHGRGCAGFDTGALRPAQHEARWRGEPQHPSSRAGRGTRSCRGVGRCTADAVRASTRARCARLSMRLVGEQDFRASEAMRRGGVANPHLPHPEPTAGRGRVEGWAGARPTPLRASTRARCARLSMRLVGEQDFRAREAMRRGGVADPNVPHPEPAAGRGRVEGWAGARPRPCVLRQALRAAQHEVAGETRFSRK